MKKLILLSAFLVLSTLIFAQDFEKIKAHKVAHLTEELSLSPEEAEKFWPVYNKYDEQLHEYRVIQRNVVVKQIKEKGGIDKLTDKEASKLLQQFSENRDAIMKTEKEKQEALMKILTPKKMLKLIKAERGFRNKLMKRLKSKKEKRFGKR